MEPRFGQDFSRVRVHPAASAQAGPLVTEPDEACEREAKRVAAEADGEAPAEAGPRRDFSRVRIHTDRLAAESAKGLHARAFTVGNQIVFGSGQYAPASMEGRRLLAHELTHVVQQSGGGPARIARAPLDLEQLDWELWMGAPLTQTSGEIGKSATCNDNAALPIEAFVYPNNTKSAASASATSPPGGAGSKTSAPEKPEETEAPPRREVTGQPDSSHWRKDPSGLFVPAKRALVVGGIHGDELGSVPLAEALKSRLESKADPLARDFDTILIPQMNPWGVQNQDRLNACKVDLNRNFPGIKGAPEPKAGTSIPKEQPETAAVRKVVEVLKPDRILALHATSTKANAGAFADPSKDPAAVALACRMALRMRGKKGAAKREVNVRGNKLDTGICSALYPAQGEVDVTTKNASLGTWASAPEAVGGRGTPVITHEIGGKEKLAQTGDRSVAAILPGLEEFLLDEEGNPSESAALLREAASDAFLTGEATKEDAKVLARIKGIVNESFKGLAARYDEWLKLQPKDVRDKLKRAGAGKLTNKSHDRTFQEQAGIVKGALGSKLTKKSTESEIEQAILDVMTTRSMPGISRHAWGTDIDVIDPKRTRWEPGGDLEPVIPFLEKEAEAFGFFHPYTKTPPDPALRHYAQEPWHLSYWPIATILQEEWASRIQGAVLDALIGRTATAVRGPVDQKTMEKVLKGIRLREFQTNVASPPAGP